MASLGGDSASMMGSFDASAFTGELLAKSRYFKKINRKISRCVRAFLNTGRPMTYCCMWSSLALFVVRTATGPAAFPP